MSDAVVVAIISGSLTLLGTIITVLMANKKTDNNLKVSQAVMEEKITELTREVRAHNNFAQRMPVVEEQIKMINQRLTDLEDDRK